jgi:hypothetical protein
MNQKLKDVSKGKVVNKALTVNTGVDEFPRYVVEYLIESRNAVGDAARHAGRGFRAPGRPMSLGQAKTLFRDLATKWITTK